MGCQEKSGAEDIEAAGGGLVISLHYTAKKRKE